MDDVDLSQLFTREVQFGDRVIRRPLYFYVGLNKLGRILVERLIKQHGGQTVSHPKASDNQIIYLIDPLSKPEADGPLVHSVHFVHECVQAGHLLDVDGYRIRHRYEHACSGAPSEPAPPHDSKKSKISAAPTTPEKKARVPPEVEQQEQEQPRRTPRPRRGKRTTTVAVGKTLPPLVKHPEKPEIPPPIRHREEHACDGEPSEPLPPHESRKSKSITAPATSQSKSKIPPEREQDYQEQPQRRSLRRRSRRTTTVRKTLPPVVKPPKKPEVWPEVEIEEESPPRALPSSRARKNTTPIIMPPDRRKTAPELEDEGEENQRQEPLPRPGRDSNAAIVTPQDERRTRQADQEDEEEPLQVEQQQEREERQRTPSPRRTAIQRAIRETDKHEQGSEILLEETSPPSPSERWTLDEDNRLREVCETILKRLRMERMPPTRLFHINTWKALWNKHKLPARRSAAQCRQRAMHLRRFEQSGRNAGEGLVPEQSKKILVRKRQQEFDDEELDDEIQPVSDAQRPTKVQRVGTPEQQMQSNPKRLSRTKQFIRSMVRSLSYETQMTQRRVFQVLRANSGDRAKTKSMLLKERRDSETQKRNRR
ncbi:hypothetical protein FGB62_30g048 [Gracilaria domingensis]|nr:hypothetical protein FGB62_30g048 [Gracilaria domingensis]